MRSTMLDVDKEKEQIRHCTIVTTTYVFIMDFRILSLHQMDDSTTTGESRHLDAYHQSLYKVSRAISTVIVME